MPRLILINGAPGCGKSTIATWLAQEQPLTLALDIDAIKHALGRWADDPVASGLHARRLAVAIAHEQLTAGHHVIIGQYVAQTGFIKKLEHLAPICGAEFHEFVLNVDAATLAGRIKTRQANPDRVEHAVNNRLVHPDEAAELVESINALRHRRPHAVWIDAGGSVPETAARIRDHLPAVG